MVRWPFSSWRVSRRREFERQKVGTRKPCEANRGYAYRTEEALAELLAAVDATEPVARASDRSLVLDFTCCAFFFWYGPN